jgi:hypothetical protein
MIIPVGKSFMIFPDSHSGCSNDKEGLALCLAFLILGVLLMLIGWLYEVIKNKDFSFYVMDNLLLFVGTMITSTMLVLGILIGLTFLIYSLI